MVELLARVTAVLRRSGRLSAQLIEIADLIVNEDAGVVQRAGQPIDLTATERRLLLYLARHRGRVLVAMTTSAGRHDEGARAAESSGTTSEYPNWSRKMRWAVEDLRKSG